MDFNIEFQLSSLFIIFIFMYQFFSKKKVNNTQNQIYGILLITTAITLVFDIGSVITICHMDAHPVLNLIFTKGYVCSMAIWVSITVLYALAINQNEKSSPFLLRCNHILRYIFFFASLIVVLTTIFTKLNYWHQGRLVYSYGLAPSMMYIYAATALLLVLIYTLLNHQNIPRQKCLSLYIYCFLQGITAMIQFLYPKLLLVSVGGTLSIVFIYFSLENPDMALIEELDKERKRADAANEAKAEFLAHMSHEIRTPINVILGMDEMILREATEPQTLDYASQIQTAGNSLLSIINDILDFSKIESGKTEIIPVEYGTASILNDLATLSRLRIEKKHLTLKLSISPDIPSRLLGDEIRIKQVITNLLTNAEKYTKEGYVTLAAHTEPLSDTQVSLVVQVIDTGIGMKKEDLPRLFSAFERLEEERNRHIEGSGLGMAICYQLTKAMGGRITVDTVYGQGSTFTVTIPQTIVDATPIGDFNARYAKSTGKVKKSSATFTAPEARILIVDDNQVNLTVAAGLLKRTKMQIDLASSGRECLHLVTQYHYHMILMDHLMPEMDGIETLQAMKELSANLCTDTPVIALTANAISGAKETYLKAGFLDYLSKPINSKKLEDMLLRYLPKELIISN